ncbi:MAG TPA: DUF4476 domain-containing protein [Bacteroidia bacterium]|nr:DUF4476 domain-containing protein [Bacteroidia bacterium]
MKVIFRAVISAFLVTGSFIGFAQTSNAILFTENGERFTVILNGLRQNENPETNVKVVGLNAEFYKLKIIFADASLGEKNFNMAIQSGTESTYVIKKNNKNEYVLRPVSMINLAQAPSPDPVTNTPPPATGITTAPATYTQQTTTTTTTTTGAPAGASVSMGVNVNDNGFNMNVSGFDDGNAVTTTQQTTTVTTATSTVAQSPPPAQMYQDPPPPPPAYLPGYNGPVGCSQPMLPGDFEAMKNSISSKTFEESKMTIAKQIINANCLLSSQVKEVMLLFTYEDSRLDFAKYAYGKTYDIGNYYKVNDAFTFESSIDDLNDYISSYRR